MKSARIRLSNHAKLKFDVLRSHGLDISQQMVIETVRHPSKVSPGYRGRRVAQSGLDGERVLRVVYEETPREVFIVTFYPARRARYEKD